MGSVCGCCANWWPWGVGVMSGPSRAVNRFVGFWVVLVNGPNTVCGVLPPGTPSKGESDHGVLGGNRLPDCRVRVVAADGLSAGGWGRWCASGCFPPTASSDTLTRFGGHNPGRRHNGPPHKHRHPTSSGDTAAHSETGTSRRVLYDTHHRDDSLQTNANYYSTGPVVATIEY